MTNPYIFHRWNEGEIDEYFSLNSVPHQTIYPTSIGEKDMVSKTKFILNKLNLSDNNYEDMVRLTGRPEILCELELTISSLQA